MQHDLQAMMQDLVGIVRRQDELERALDGLDGLRTRAARVRVDGHRQYNPGWHTALALRNMLVVSRPSRVRRSRGARAVARTSATTIPARTRRSASSTSSSAAERGAMEVVARPIPELPAELARIIAENA